jgi:predicted transcriptional regulator
MPDEHCVTIRLSPQLYAQLEAVGSHGQPLAVIVRQALADYLSRQRSQPVGTDTPATTLADMAASVAELQAQVQALTARVDPLAAERLPVADTAGQPVAAAAASDSPPTAADTPGRRPRGHRRGLPLETLTAIADERTQCEGLSLRAFAMRLYDKGIYRAKGDKPVDAGTLARWLTQARAQGLL